MTFVVDTGVVSALLSKQVRPHLAPAVAKAAGQRFLLAPQTVAELRFGALVAGWAGRRQARLEIDYSRYGHSKRITVPLFKRERSIDVGDRVQVVGDDVPERIAVVAALVEDGRQAVLEFED